MLPQKTSTTARHGNGRLRRAVGIACLLVASHASGEEIVQLPSANGATLPYLLNADLPAAAPP